MTGAVDSHGHSESAQGMWRLVAISAAAVVFTVISGIIADTILTAYEFSNILVLSFFQNWVLFLVGLSLESLFSSQHSPTEPGDHPLPVPPGYGVVLGVCLASNVFFTNYASSLLTYPVQVILKSSKLLITMGMRSLAFGKPNARVDYVGAVLLCAGLVFFVVPSHTLYELVGWQEAAEAAAAAETGEATSWTLGLIAISVALVAESGMLALEDHVLFARYNVSHSWIMREGYMYAGIAHLAGVVLSGNASHFVSSMGGLSRPLTLLLCLFPMILGVGVNFQLKLVQLHGSVIASACQVFRKIASVCLSMVLFHRSFGSTAAIGAVLVGMSFVVKAVHKIFGIPCLKDPEVQQVAKPRTAARRWFSFLPGVSRSVEPLAPGHDGADNV